MGSSDRRAVLALFGALGSLVLLPGCGNAKAALPDYRYRLTVEIETSEGVRTGSSVIEVSTAVAGRNSIPTPGVVSHRLRGEAVTVDLGTRGLLFALLRSDDNSDWASNVMFGFAPEMPAVYDSDGKFDSTAHFHARFTAMLKNREPIVLPQRFRGSRYIEGGFARPMLVRFADIADPTTVEKVDPDNLAASFGPGVKIKRIIVQLTDDPVTTGIERHLGWLPYQRGSLVRIPRGVPIGDMPIGSELTEGDFSRSLIL